MRGDVRGVSWREDPEIAFRLDRADGSGGVSRLDGDGKPCRQAVADGPVVLVRDPGRHAGPRRRGQEERRILLEIASIVNSTLELPAVLNVIMDNAVELLQAEAGSLVLVDTNTGELVFEVTAGPASPDLVGTRLPPDTGIVGAVVQDDRPMIIGQAQADHRWYRGLDDCTEFLTESIIAVPMRSRGEVIGVIELLNRRDGAPFDGDDEGLLMAFASNAAVAITNARLYEDARRRLSEAELVQEVALTAVSTLDFDLVLERAVGVLRRGLGIERIGFLLPSEEGDTLVPHPSLDDFAGDTLQIPIAGSLVGRAYATGRPMLVRDLADGRDCLEAALDARSALAVPIQIGKRVIAVLHAESPRVGAFGEDELRLCTTIAGHLGMTLENARLYHRLEAQAAELSRAYDELQEINRRRGQVVQNVGHELRTPISLIRGYAELLAERELGPVLDEQQDALQVIREQSAVLTRLIYNLTMLQAVPGQTLALVPLPVADVVRQIPIKFRRAAEKAGIRFREDVPQGLPVVQGDRERLGLVFSHLVDNAIKFSPSGGTVTLRARADQDAVYVSVADEGIGIAPEHLSRIFQRFYQVDGTTTRRFGGMGVGLALVSEIVEAHGGTVSVESQVGEGTTFTVAFPRCKPPTQ